MSPIERLTPRSALHQNRVDLPVPANTVHCIKTAWIFRNCGIASLHHCIKTAWIFWTAPTISTSYKLWQTRKKPRGPEDIRRRDRKATRAWRHGFCFVLRVKRRDCTHNHYCRHHHRYRASPAYALWAWKETETETQRSPPSPHRAGRQPAVTREGTQHDSDRYPAA